MPERGVLLKGNNAGNADSASVTDETRTIQGVAMAGLVLNLLLAAVKGVLAVQSGSLAVTASAIDSGTDAVASLVLYGGLRLSVRKTWAFPLGLYKIENILSVLLAFFIFLAGYEIARRVFIAEPGPPDISMSLIFWLLAATGAVYLFGCWALRVSRRTESPTLKAEARHRQTDALSSLVVLVSVALGYGGVQFDIFGISIDQMGAALVLVFVGRAGWELLSDGMRVLLDASIDYDALEEVRDIMKSHPSVVEVKSLVGRSAGRFRFLQGNVVVRTDDLEKAHRISHEIESRIRSRIPRVERVMIHYEPQARDHLRIAVPLADRTGKISVHFGEAPFFAVLLVRVADHRVEKKEIIANPHGEAEKSKGILVAEWLVDRKVDWVALRSEMKHKGPGYVFSGAGIRVHQTSADHVDDAVNEIIENEKNQEAYTS